MVYLAVLVVVLWLSAGAHGASIAIGDSCQTGTDFEKAGYLVRAARVESPFGYLNWLRTAIHDEQSDVSGLAGKPYSSAAVREKADALDKRLFADGIFEQRVKVSLVLTSVENCSNGELDVVYYVATTQIAPVLSGTFESTKLEKTSPQSAALMDPAENRWRFSPSASYDPSEKFAGGARVEYRVKGSSSRIPIDSMVLDGRGSAAMHEVNAAVGGVKDDAADWLDHLEWHIDYLNTANPTGGSKLRQNRGAAQLSAITQPLGSLPLSLRFGGQAEGGTLRSDFRPSELSRDTVDGSGYGSMKLYLGTTARLARNVFGASYGLEVGSTKLDSGVGWIKHIGDIAHDFSWPFGDHRSLDVESRLTAGIIQLPGSIPAAARFFGGNREEPFITGDSWNIRSNPVIRSIPANRFSHTHDGRGGTRFISYNLTAGIPIWRKPLIPSELSHNEEFKDQLGFGLKTATSTVQTSYAAKDPHYKAVASRVDDVKTSLETLRTAVAAAESSSGDAFATLFKPCVSAINTATRRTRGDAESTGPEQYGRVQALLSVDEDLLGKVRANCVTTLNGKLRDERIQAAGEALEQIHADMEREFAQIDQAEASRQAEAEMSYVKRTLNSIIYELNLASLGPVVMFDVAHIGPASSKLGTRYGIGGGLRFTLVSHVDFTIGYVANPKRLPGERPGAFSFSTRFRDLLD
ncbi:MAG TPA: hypothetical protein VIB79_10545 [Candidatus Binatia bacterium]